MIFSYNTLKSYFNPESSTEAFPTVTELQNLLTLKAFEVDDISKRENDYLFDIKITPDRAPYAYGLRFIAIELSLIVPGLNLFTELLDVTKSFSKENTIIKNSYVNSELVEEVEDEVWNYTLTRVHGVNNTDHIPYVTDYMHSLNMPSRGILVDMTNIIMFDTGNPIHIYDADKVIGNIRVSKSIEGEKAVILGGRVVDLEVGTLVIRDDKNILAIAGVKGCASAEVDNNTRNIIIESANFDRIKVRKAAKKYNILNDSTKRFEQGIDDERHIFALDTYLHFLKSFLKNVDIKNTETARPFDTVIKPQLELICDKNKVLKLIKKDYLSLENDFTDFLKDTLTKAGVKVSFGDSIRLHVPSYRSDLRTDADIADEYIRNKGYAILDYKAKEIIRKGPDLAQLSVIEKKINYIQKTLIKLGFHEIINHTLVNSKEDENAVALENALNADRNSMRSNLAYNVTRFLDLNLKNIDLVATSKNDIYVKLFEIGNVFKVNTNDITESMKFAFGVSTVKWPKGVTADMLMNEIADYLKLTTEPTMIGNSNGDKTVVWEYHLNDILNNVDLDSEYESTTTLKAPKTIVYKELSQYPSMIRDIAFFVEDQLTLSENDITALISNLVKDIPDVVNHYIFDIFKKEDKTSYAFRFGFQNVSKTLTEAEVTAHMDTIRAALTQRDFILR